MVTHYNNIPFFFLLNTKVVMKDLKQEEVEPEKRLKFPKGVRSKNWLNRFAYKWPTGPISVLVRTTQKHK